MAKKIKIGIIRETKNTPDGRVAFSPKQIIEIQNLYPFVNFLIQSSLSRCFSDSEYEALKIPVVENVEKCDILMGIKEVDKTTLIPGKTYLFFSHVGKKQLYNREMLHAIIKNRIRLIDYEYLTNNSKKRVVAFGKWAGILGAYHGLRALGLKTSRFYLRSPKELKSIYALWKELEELNFEPGFKILVTGRGRVAHGAVQLLKAVNMEFVNPDDFIEKEFDKPVACQVSSKDYYRHKDGIHFNVNHFHQNPEEFVSFFLPYTKATDLLITGHYWDPRSSVLFTTKDMKQEDFRINVIADITCDINGSIPTTIRTTSIDNPYYCYNRELEVEDKLFSNPENITVMSIDNLASELPKDASIDFGQQLIEHVLDHLLTSDKTEIIERATIAKDGKLTSSFKYLSDYIGDTN